jgi:histidinol-phosphate/aromatic aminotransferase/cobyric acid decarboxylase-like protein
VPPEEVVVGNGSSDLLYVLPRAFRVSRVVVPVPSYVDTACSTRRTVLT